MKDIRYDKISDAVTTGANAAGDNIDISDMKDVAISAIAVGDLDADIQLKVSMNGEDWFNKGSAVAAGGADASATWEIANNPWKLARVDVENFASGSSDITVERMGKVYE